MHECRKNLIESILIQIVPKLFKNVRISDAEKRGLISHLMKIQVNPVEPYGIFILQKGKICTVETGAVPDNETPLAIEAIPQICNG